MPAWVPFVDVPIYVMTPEFGAASQLEKIDMLDFAELVAINKFDRKGAEDAVRDVRKQLQRNREAFSQTPEQMPVYGTIASRFNDDGVTALYQGLRQILLEAKLADWPSGRLPNVTSKMSSTHPRHCCAGAPTLSRRDCANCSCLPRLGRCAGGAGAREPAVARKRAHASRT